MGIVIDIRERFLDKTFVVDSFSVSVFVSVIEGGKKTREVIINVPRGFYAADLTDMLNKAVEQVKAQIESEAAGA